MELKVNKDYNLENLVKEWGFEKYSYYDYDIYLKESYDHSSVIQVYSDRDIFIHQSNEISVDDEILCLLYDLIKAGIIIKIEVA